MTKNLHGQMNEPCFRDCPFAPGSAALVMPASGEACTTKVPIFGESCAGTVFQGRHRNTRCLSIEIFDWRAAMKGQCAND